MGFFNYQQATELYKNDSFMIEIINSLEKVDQYHLLRNRKYVDLRNLENLLPFITNDYRKWISLCDGGLLFSTTLLSTTEYDEELEISFATIQEINTDENLKYFGLPKGYMVIALLNYGDPICLSEKDSKVYLWDNIEKTFSVVWDTFSDFLADEYNTAVQMIEDDALEAIPLKILEE